MLVAGLSSCPGPTAAFDCQHKLCPEIATCAEARYKLFVCGHSERDADNDGIPCESMCGGDVATFELRSRDAWPSALPFAETPKRNTFEFIPPAHADPAFTTGFACEGKRRCGQMLSCAEAQFYLNACGVASLDRDRDGTPCESLCGGR